MLAGTAKDPTRGVLPRGSSTPSLRCFPFAETGIAAIDANGNLTGKTDSTGNWTYEWNAENQLIRVTKDAAEVARFAYDPKGRRVEEIASGVTQNWTYDTRDILRETATGSAAVRYVTGESIDEPLAREDVSGNLSYYQADGLGSILKTTDSAGSVTLTRQYDAWGSLQQGATVAGYAFTGREWDPQTGLYYYRARYYDPTVGRFLSEDPLGVAKRSRREASAYGYTGNDPANEVDPTGEGIVDCAKVLAELAEAVALLVHRIAEYNTRTQDAGHLKAIIQLQKRVDELILKAGKHCKDFKAPAIPPIIPRCIPFIIIDIEEVCKDPEIRYKYPSICNSYGPNVA